MSTSSNKYRTGGQNEGGKAGKRKEEEREGEGRKKTMYCIACMSKHVSHQWCVTELRVKTSRDKVACVCVRVCVSKFFVTLLCVCARTICDGSVLCVCVTELCAFVCV